MGALEILYQNVGKALEAECWDGRDPSVDKVNVLKEPAPRSQ